MKRILLLITVVFIYRTESNEKVRLADISAITLRKGEYTTGRRSAPVPQLQCVGGSAKGRFEPRVVQCYNRGFDGNDVQWECKAEMSDHYEFGKIQVSCEGFSYPDDPFILKGSCGLEYELEFTESGRRAAGSKQPSAPPYEEEKPLLYHITTAVIILVVLSVIYIICTGPRQGNEGDRYRGNSGWNSGPPPPPPPPGPGKRPPPPGFRTDHFSQAPPTYDEACQRGASCGTGSQQGQQSDSGPGFFTGLGLGGIAGYMLGRNSFGDSPRYRGPSQYERSTGFFRDEEPSTSQRQRTPSPTTRTTSGFGGTKRR